jgi:hypothetical protein
MTTMTGLSMSPCYNRHSDEPGNDSGSHSDRSAKTSIVAFLDIPARAAAAAGGAQRPAGACHTR